MKSFLNAYHLHISSLFLIAIFCTAMPLLKFLVPPALILITIYLLMLWGSGRVKLIKRGGWVVVFPVVLYVLYAIGGIYSPYPDRVLVDLQVKSAILFVPLFYLFELKEPKLSLFPSFISIMRVWIAGITAYLLFCIIRSTVLFAQGAGWSIFFSGELTPFVHHTYVSLLAAIGIVSLFFRSDLIRHKGWRISLILFLVLGVVIVVSRGGILALFSFIILYAIYNLLWKRNYKKGVIPLLITGAILVVMATTSSVVERGLARLYTNPKAFIDGNKENSGEDRYLIWEVAVQVFAQKPLTGYGTGSTSPELTKAYVKDDYMSYAEAGWNAHNQYLQTAIAIGVFGLLFLLLSLFYPMLLSWKMKDKLILAFFYLLAFNYISESFLELQTGVCIYAFVIFIASRELEGSSARKLANAKQVK